MLPSELAPVEDRGFIFIGMNGPEGASLDYMDRHVRILEGMAAQQIETGDVVRVSARVPGGFGGAGSQVNEARGFLLLAPWSERERTADQIAQSLRGPLNAVPGVRAFVTVPGGFGGGGAPVQVVLQGTEYADLVQWRDLLMQRMGENPGLTNVAVELRRAQAATQRRGRPQPRRRSRRFAADRVAHARNRARLAHRHDVHRP